MPEEKRRNPFEEFIDSEAFDVSKLDGTISPVRDEMEVAIQELLADLQPINYELWDTLDERQKSICAYLTAELIDNVLRGENSEFDLDLSNEELVQAVTIPIILAMIAEERLHKPEPPQADPIVVPQRFEYKAEANPNLPASWGEIFKNIITQTRLFFRNLLSRWRNVD